MDHARVPVIEWNLGTFFDSKEFQSWKPNFRTDVCMRTAELQVTVQELVSSRSITGRHNFLDFDMFDAMSASALKKLINTQSTYRKRVRFEQPLAQNSDGFLRRRQIAYMIHEYFRATYVCETVQGLADFVSMTLQNDD